MTDKKIVQSRISCIGLGLDRERCLTVLTGRVLACPTDPRVGMYDTEVCYGCKVTGKLSLLLGYWIAEMPMPIAIIGSDTSRYASQGSQTVIAQERQQTRLKILA